MIIGMAFAHEAEHIQAVEHYKELEQKLLSMGGKELVYMPSLPQIIRAIIDEGQVFDTLPVELVKGKPSHCHENVDALWLKGKGKYRSAHGYGLSEDGLWRQHSWLVKKNGIIVETTVVRKMYYGILLR